MSAIFGIFNVESRKLSIESIKKMESALLLRKKDGSNIVLKGSSGFGCMMFCITPESLNEELPYYSNKRKLLITGDIRIDNRDELLERLEMAEYDFNLISDSLLFLRCYEKWEKECVNYIIGSFVAVIYDENREEVICITDHMGSKGVYYYFDGAKFIFASEIKAIRAVSEVNAEIDLKIFAKTALPGLGRIENDSSLFSNIHFLNGSMIMSVTKEGIKHYEYWKPDINKELSFKNEDDYIEAFQEVLFKSVKSSMRSAYPVVSLYSGGLDSSAITASAAYLSESGNSHTAFSAILQEGYEGSGTDEKKYIDMLKGKENLEIEYITDFFRGPFDNLEQLVTGGESPNYTSRHYLYSAFADAAKAKGARVMLDGCFGEIGPTFHGDGYYAELLLKGNFLKLINEIRAKGEIEERSPISLIKELVIKPLIPPYLKKHLVKRFDIMQSINSSPVRKEFIERVLGINVKDESIKAAELFEIKADHKRNQLRAIEMSRRAKFQNGFAGYQNVRIVSPFLDKRVIEFCLAIPGDMKVKNGYKRYAIRSGMKGILPDEIRFRTTKEAFSPDFHDRYNRQKQWAVDFIKSIERSELMKEIVDFEKLEKMLAYKMETNGCSTPSEFAAMHSVPRGIYLLMFLKLFGNR